MIGSKCVFEDWNFPDITGVVVSIEDGICTLESGRKVAASKFLWFADV